MNISDIIKRIYETVESKTLKYKLNINLNLFIGIYGISKVEIRVSESLETPNYVFCGVYSSNDLDRIYSVLKLIYETWGSTEERTLYSLSESESSLLKDTVTAYKRRLCDLMATVDDYEKERLCFTVT